MSKGLELPNLPPSKTGWPWTAEIPQYPATLPDGSPWPRISIVTPSFNQAEFIEETIRSVLLQGYPNLEYFIIDGGSTDRSVEIIKKYEPWLTYWVSELDRGQSHAINKGWERATGEIIAYLNSDDTYLEGALIEVGRLWSENPGINAVVGSIVSTNERSEIDDRILKPKLPQQPPLDLTTIDHEKWFLPQQSGFFRREYLLKNGGFLIEELHYTMDRELYYRLCSSKGVILSDKPMASYRFQDKSKSISQTLNMYKEDPHSLSYFMNGDMMSNIQRFVVGRQRVAQGHYKFSKQIDDWRIKLWHLWLAGLNRPGYFLRKGYWFNIARCFGIDNIYRQIRNSN